MLQAEATPDTPRIDRGELRQAFGCFATGVTIITAYDPDGRPRGMTANSFTSVSLDPALILVCVATSAPIWTVLAAAPAFSVNVLSEHQREISQRFATPTADKFAGIAWSAPDAHGGPILADVAAHLACRRVREVEVGDHMLLIGEVVDFTRSPSRPLIFHQGAYRAVA
jgi:flavin reductase (DIM6/NTAB) family NADH-FMN oxidoreductase RutF